MDTVALIIIGVIVLVIVIVVIMFILRSMKGKIAINLDKYDFSPGETISGTVVLKLKKPVDATELSVGLVGTRETSSYSRNSKGAAGASKNTKEENIYNFKKPISGEKQYPVGESSYPFQIVVPKDTGKFSTGNQVADTVIKSMQFLSGATSKIEWYVLANLDMKGFDISKQVRVNIG
jgi:hypothetical protein